MVEDGELDGDNVASSSFNSVVAALDLFAQIEPPGRVVPRGVEDRSHVVFQYNSSKESHVDVSSELEDILVLPILRYQLVLLLYETLRVQSRIILPLFLRMRQSVPILVFLLLVDREQ